MDDRICTKLRTRLAMTPRCGPGRGLPRPLRLEIAQYAAARCAEGAAITEVAADLGMHPQTLRRWLSRASDDAFEVVQVLAPATSTSATFTVLGPAGVRVEGLDLDTLAALLRRLAS